MSKFKKAVFLVMLIATVFSNSFVTYASSNVNSPTTSVLLHETSRVISNAMSVFNDFTNRSCTVQSTYELLDYNGNASFVLVVFGDVGYAISSFETGEVIEIHPNSTSPYEGVVGDYYYAGPLNYLYKAGNGFVDTRTGNTVTDMEFLVLQEIVEQVISQELLLKKQLEPRSRLGLRDNMTVTRSSASVSYSSYVANQLAAGVNTLGTCRSIAAGMLLATFQEKLSANLLTAAYLPQSPYTDLLARTKAESLHQALQPYCESNALIWADAYCTGINSFLTAINKKNATAHYMYAPFVNSYIVSSINSDKVCVVATMEATGIHSYGFHALLCWAYDLQSNGNYILSCRAGWYNSSSDIVGIYSNWLQAVCYLS